MKRTTRMALVVAAASAAFAASPDPAHAQRPVQIGISAGASLPMGDLRDEKETGYHVTGIAEIAPLMMPFGVRAEVMFNQLKLKNGSGDKYNLFGVTGDAVVGMPGVVVAPYVIGGVGFYNSKISGLDDSSNDFGLNAGVGAKFRLGAFSTFGEIRYHNIFTDGTSTRFLPITFGVLF